MSMSPSSSAGFGVLPIAGDPESSSGVEPGLAFDFGIPMFDFVS
jgi:hypothetical protein